jgi:hypothetical protein
MFDKHSTECETLAAATYPNNPKFVETRPAYTTPSRPAVMDCQGYGYSIQCVTTDPGDLGKRVPADGFIYDANAKARDAYWDRCMSGKGWYQEKVEKTSAKDNAQQKNKNSCSKADDCGKGEYCLEGACVPFKKSAPLAGACSLQSECDRGHYCSDKKCVPFR